MEAKQQHGKYTLLMLLVMTLWGALYVSNRVVLAAMPVMAVIFFRFTLASAVLLIAGRLMHLEPIRREDLPLMLFLGLFGFFGSNALLTVCTALTSASLSSLLNAMNPLFIAFFAHFMLKERVTLRQLVLIILSIIGAGIIIGAPGTSIDPVGIVCAFLSICFWSISSVYMKRLSGKYHPLMITAYGQGVAGLAGLVGTLISLGRGASITVTPEVIGNLLFLALGATAVGHMLWNYCLAHEDASRCASFYPVQPMVSILLGVLILHEKMTLSFVIGSVIIILSVAMNSLPEKKK